MERAAPQLEPRRLQPGRRECCRSRIRQRRRQQHALCEEDLAASSGRACNRKRHGKPSSSARSRPAHRARFHHKSRIGFLLERLSGGFRLHAHAQRRQWSGNRLLCRCRGAHQSEKRSARQPRPRASTPPAAPLTTWRRERRSSRACRAPRVATQPASSATQPVPARFRHRPGRAGY